MSFQFEGFSTPNGTFVPDEVFDVLAPELSEAELRVLLYIIRRTFGFKKNTDDISLKQMTSGIITREGRVLDRGTGLSKAGNARGIRGLTEKGIIVTTRNRSVQSGDQATTYTLRFKEVAGASGGRGEKHTPNTSSTDLDQEHIASASSNRVSTKETGGCLPKRQGGVYQVDTQETVLQQTDLNLSNIRKQHAAKFEIPPSTPPAKPSVSVASPQSSSLESIGTVLFRIRPQSSDTSPEEAEAAIRVYIEETAKLFSDQAPLRSSTTRAINLYHNSGLTLGEFLSRLCEVRSTTKARRDKVKKQANGNKKTMAYWFACLEDRLGLRTKNQPPQSRQGLVVNTVSPMT